MHAARKLVQVSPTLKKAEAGTRKKTKNKNTKRSFSTPPQL
jgi:hypothetical protein